MRITEAAQRLGTSPRMLRYRETLGLLPALGGVGGVGPRWRAGAEAGREGARSGARGGTRSAARPGAPPVP